MSKPYLKVRKSCVLSDEIQNTLFLTVPSYHQKYMLRQQRPLLKSLGLSDSELIQSHVAARLNGYVGGNGTLEAFNEV